jgi:hypothetical protein
MALGGRNVGGAGTSDTRVDRPEEGLPGLATTTNPTANPPTRATFDAGLSVAGSNSLSNKAPGRERPSAQIDTTQTDGLPMDQSIKRGQPAAW